MNDFQLLLSKIVTIKNLYIVTLPTLFNIFLSLMLLLSIVVITVLYVCKLRSPTHRQLPHANSPRHRHSNAQSPVAVHHEGNPITSIPPTSTPIHAQHPLTLAHPQHTWSPKLTVSRQPPCPRRTRCLSCQSVGRLMSRASLAQLK